MILRLLSFSALFICPFREGKPEAPTRQLQESRRDMEPKVDSDEEDERMAQAGKSTSKKA